jgi:RecG-like helicase
MDLEDGVKLKQVMDDLADSKNGNHLTKIMPLYVSQSKKMKIALGEIEAMKKQMEEQSNIMMEQQNYLKNCLSLGVYEIKNNMFQKDIDHKVEQALNSFSANFRKEMSSKVDEDLFNR